MTIRNILCRSCKNTFLDGDDIYGTSCGHVFHLRCMREWQSRSSSCPQCQDYNPSTYKLYLSFEADNTVTFNELLDRQKNSSREVQELNGRLYDRNMSYAHYRVESEKEIAELKNLINILKMRIMCYEGNISKQRQQIQSLTQEVICLEAQSESTVTQLNKEIATLKQDLENISTEFAIQVSRHVDNSECQLPEATDNGLTRHTIYEVKIEMLEKKIDHLSKVLEMEITKNNHLEIDKLKLQSYVDCMNSKCSNSMEITSEVLNTIDTGKELKVSLSSLDTQSNSKMPHLTESLYVPHTDSYSRPEETRQDEDPAANSIVINNYPLEHLIYPLEETVIFVAKNINIRLKKWEVDQVNIVNSEHNCTMDGERVSLFVRFRKGQIKTRFLRNNGYLNTNINSYLRTVRVKDYFDENLHEVFNYAKMKLLNNGFGEIVLKNNEIFAKITTDFIGIQIYTMQQVDALLNILRDSITKIRSYGCVLKS